MDPRLTVLTLGVRNLATSVRFYADGLGWKRKPTSSDQIAFFQLSNVVFALYPKDLLAEDATVDPKGSGFPGFTMAHNVREKSEVAKVLNLAAQSGGKIVKPAQDVFWGGHSGYFSDPDGYLWEVAWNPKWQLDASGQVSL
jgi:uncharacterized glyoxalase superfamily protein PhnB